MLCAVDGTDQTFMSKSLARAVAQQLTVHMTAHNLHEPLQSAYKAFHSAETTLVNFHNDVLCARDKQGIVILLVLDLSAAFDTIDHRCLLTRMEYTALYFSSLLHISLEEHNAFRSVESALS